MKPSERNVMNAKWYCTNGLILTVLANIIEPRWLSLIVFASAVVQYVWVLVEINNARRNACIEEHERKEMHKRIKKLLNEIDDLNDEFKKEMKKKK